MLIGYRKKAIISLLRITLIILYGDDNFVILNYVQKGHMQIAVPFLGILANLLY
jgi:hypothetical protein